MFKTYHTTSLDLFRKDSFVKYTLHGMSRNKRAIARMMAIGMIAMEMRDDDRNHCAMFGSGILPVDVEGGHYKKCGVLLSK